MTPISRGSSTSLGAVALAALLLAAPLAAQAPSAGASDAAERVLRGRVELGTRPVGATEVTLHRVTTDSAGVVRSVRTDPSGEFALRLPPADSAGFAVYFATADYQGVRYFGPVLHAAEELTGYRLAVHDTSSAAGVVDSVRVRRRDIVLIPQEAGGWEVNEVVALHNPATRTLIPRSGVEGWTLRIPPEASSFEAADIDAAPVRLERVGESVVLLSPLPPGERSLFFRYRLPASAASIDVRPNAGTDTLSVFVQQPSPDVQVAGLAPTRLVPVEDQRLLQWELLAPPADEPLRVRWDRPTPASPTAVGAGIALLVLAVGGWAALRNRGAA